MKKILAAILLAGVITLSAFASGAGQVTTSSLPLNVRSAPGGSVVGSAASKSMVTLISKSGSWWYAQYAPGKYGYLSASYIKELGGSEKTVALSWGSLNVRSGPGTGYAVSDKLSSGTGVIVLSESAGWSRVLYSGNKTGWVSSAYLSGGTAAAKYARVSLSVPDYKQTDSRWASVTLGSSGQSISRIGCTTCAVAMCESYRQARTVTPSALAASVSYTSGGALYWPAGYVQDYRSDTAGYLSLIYEKLSQGKPVIIGAKTASGSTHWVVVTGFAGGNSLSASSFTINDPATSTRTLLSQYLAKYPYIMKAVFYN